MRVKIVPLSRILSDTSARKMLVDISVWFIICIVFIVDREMYPFSSSILRSELKTDWTGFGVLWQGQESFKWAY